MRNSFYLPSSQNPSPSDRRLPQVRHSRTGQSVFVFRRPLQALSRPAYAGFRERSAAPFRVRAKRPLTVHELTRISRIQIEFVQICGDSWTICQGLSLPRPLPPGGLRPQPRKPTALRAAGHERALWATRNPPNLPSNHETASPRSRSSRGESDLQKDALAVEEIEEQPTGREIGEGHADRPPVWRQQPHRAA